MTYLFTIVTVLLCIASMLYTPTHEKSSFYMLPTRFWEMMFGGLAFMLEGKISRLKLKKIVNICGYIAIILSFILVNTDMEWPGLFTLFPVCGTFLIISTNLNRSIFIKHEIVQFVGKISYSLYLWHWPIYVASNYMGIEKNNLSIIILIFISFLFAVISFKFIESTHMRRVKLVSFIMTFTLICTLTLSYFNLNVKIFDPNILSIVNYPQDHELDIKKQFSGGGCFLSSEDKGIQDFNADGCLRFRDGEKNILLLGDSHAADIAGSIREKLGDRGINLMEATASGCLPIVNPKGEKRCTALIDYVFKDFVLKNKSKIDGVILSANWLLADKLNQKDIIKDIYNTITYLNKNKIPTIILGQNEIYTIPYVNIAAKNVEYKRDITKNFIDRKSLKINDFLQKEFFQQYVNIYNLPSIPMLSPHNEPYMFDQNHYTKYGADLITNRILLDSITIKFLTTPKL